MNGPLWRNRNPHLLSSVLLYASPLRAMRDLPDRPGGLPEPAPMLSHT